MIPVQPVEVLVLGIHDRYPRLLVVQIRLDRKPPRLWQQAFHTADGLTPDRPTFQPYLDGVLITITPPDHEVTVEVGLVERRIRNVNALLSGEPEDEAIDVPPARLSQAIAQDSLSADVRERMDAARRQARSISNVFTSGAWLPADGEGHET